MKNWEILPAIVCDSFGWFIEKFLVVGSESDEKVQDSLVKWDGEGD